MVTWIIPVRRANGATAALPVDSGRFKVRDTAGTLHTIKTANDDDAPDPVLVKVRDGGAGHDEELLFAPSAIDFAEVTATVAPLAAALAKLLTITHRGIPATLHLAPLAPQAVAFTGGPAVGYTVTVNKAAGGVAVIPFLDLGKIVRVHVRDAQTLPHAVANEPDENPPTGNLLVRLADSSAESVPATPSVLELGPVRLSVTSPKPDIIVQGILETLPLPLRVLQPRFEHSPLRRLPPVRALAVTLHAPTVTHGGRAGAIGPVHLGVAPLAPASVALTIGALEPPTPALGLAPIAPRITHRPLRRLPPVLHVSTLPIAPGSPGLGHLIRPAVLRVTVRGLAPGHLEQSPSTPTPAPGHVAVTAHAVTLRRKRKRIQGVGPVNLGAAPLTLAARTQGSPPSQYVPPRASVHPLAPHIGGTLARTPNVGQVAAQPVAPVVARITAHRTPTRGHVAVHPLAPTLGGAKSIAPAVLGLGVNPRAPARVRRGQPLPVLGLALTPLAPTVTLPALVIAPAVLRLSAGLPELDADTPLQVADPDVARLTVSPLAIAAFTAAGQAKVIAPAVLRVEVRARQGFPLQWEPGQVLALEAQVVTSVVWIGEVPHVNKQAQQNSVGLEVLFQLVDFERHPIDLTDADTVTLMLDPPVGPTKVRVAQVHGEPSLGLVRYVTHPGDLHEWGLWQVQGRAQFENGFDRWSASRILDVLPNLGPQPITIPEPVPARAYCRPLAPTIAMV